MDFLNFILHLDTNLRALIENLGFASYLILFAIIFAETGLVIIPFLPGDSLLFVAGTLAGTGLLDIGLLIAVLLVAAILGDTVNYWVGHRIGARVFSRENARFFKPQYLAQTHEFFERYGGKTIILARFVPIVRTFAPFVAGVGTMKYHTFLLYNLIGAVIWVVGITLAGYFFGGIPIIQKNFEIVVIGLVAVSLLPPIIEYFRHRASRPAAESTSYTELQKTFKKEHLNE